MPCNPTSNTVIRFDLYFFKTSPNTTELRGDLTFKKPFDNSSKVSR